MDPERGEGIEETLGRQMHIGDRISAKEANPQLLVVFVIEERHIGIARLFGEGIDDLLLGWLATLVGKSAVQAIHNRPELLDGQPLHFWQEHIIDRRR